ncbi:MAG: hypothetical protein NT029_08505 [Armatimonadetes bacterium]|nr:hypothetical protein [Armatimonadota bacterium]
MREGLRVAALTAAMLLWSAMPAAAQDHTLAQAISDQAQRTTLAFSGLGMITGNLEAQSFFPPGKVADYTGFQYLRDNDPDNMGHNTSFLSRVADNVLYILTDAQLAALKAVATGQVDLINAYGYKRYPLMKAFRRLVDGTGPAGSPGLSLAAVKSTSRDLYIIDGQISFDRAVLYAEIYRSMTAAQVAYLDAMAREGWGSWPDITGDQVRDRLRGLAHDQSVAVMTYAGDLFSWYAGSVQADVYFCPERHGTYFGSFYMKDAPAIGHEGYSISQSLTADAGSALCDSRLGYVTEAQAALFTQLVDAQRNNLYAGAVNMVQARTDIAVALRSLVTPIPPTAAYLAQVRAYVLAKSAVYGELDGENEVRYATTMAQLRRSLTDAQKAKLAALRAQILCGTYADGTPFNFTVCTTPFLYSAVITDVSLLAPYIANTDYLFAAPSVQAKLAVSVQPVGTRVGAVINPPVRIAVLDATGNVVTTATTVVSLNLGINRTGAKLRGVTSVAAVAGIATFPGISIDKPGAYTLRATATGLQTVDSAPFQVK